MPSRELASPKVHEIYKFLEKNIEEEFQQLYENGEIDLKEKDRFIKEGTISIRTIHRKLDDLFGKGLVEHIGDRYSLSEKAQNEIRYYGKVFGNWISGRSFPPANPMPKSLGILLKYLWHL